MIAQLKALGKKLGRKPTDRGINVGSKFGVCAAATTFASMFGSLPGAYKAAGYNEIAPSSRRYTDDEILTAIGKLVKQSRRLPT